ncbi:penicillin-binding protein 2 [Candidatus Pelagibacter sp.]|nr:penicillin-binding protein 2 [Candidatus Pelagibacter sp.]|tara:strand:- start:412 stop:2082 length:1671 start_codon:yes stop_codon:yes gene_type:complete
MSSENNLFNLENDFDKLGNKYDKNKLNISFNRVAFIFFSFVLVLIIFSLKAFYLTGKKLPNNNIVGSKKEFRSNILDRNNNILAKTIITRNIGINPNLVIDKNKLLIKLKILFPNKNYDQIEKKINGKKFFYFAEELNPENYEKLIMLGDKSLIPENRITRLYPQRSLFSHIIGQIDNQNNGVSGIEKSFDKNLKEYNKDLKLTVDLNLQYLIREELIKFQNIFNSIGSAAILMNSRNGQILSLLSLPDFDLNERNLLDDKNLINRATKGVYELGSVFKTFTYASGLNEGLIDPDTEFKNLEKKIYCSKFQIGEYDEKIPTDLTAEQILIRSGNIGSIRIAQKVGEEKFLKFLNDLGLFNTLDFDIEEIGKPLKFRWGKCKLATSAYGHGITTTPLQLAKGYSIISNGGYNIKPTLIFDEKYKNIKYEQIISEDTSNKVNLALRKIVTTKEGTASFANIKGYEIAGKTGTAQKSIDGGYSRNKINTFASIFPASDPKYVLIVMLDEPKPNQNYIYEYKDGSGLKIKGTQFNTAGWTAVEVAGKIIEKIGPILATKY